jgi:hypothetical protein
MIAGPKTSLAFIDGARTNRSHRHGFSFLIARLDPSKENPEA